MGLFDWLLGSAQRQPLSESPREMHLARGRGYTFEIVGESFYQNNLDDICGGKCEDGHDLEITAHLVCEDDNPYDSNAVAVFIEGMKVGHIPREIAPRLRRGILRLGSGIRTVSCDAKIVGGWDRGRRDQGSYGVKLNFAQRLRQNENDF